MSSKACDELLQAAVTELVENLDVEQPEEKGAAPRTLEDWARLYVRYLGVLRKLGEVHELMAHPQKRRTVAAMLRACVGRLLEIHPWLVKLNNDVDVVPLETFLPGLGLAPDTLEVPVPACFREERAEEIATRNAMIAALRATRPPPASAATAVSDAETGGAACDPEKGEEEEEGAGSPAAVGIEAPPVTPDVRSLAGPAIPEGNLPTPGAAAVRIQAAVRGWLARRRVAQAWREELQFLGMLPPDSCRSQELQERLAAISLDRKAKQAQRRVEYEEALVSVKAKLKRQEGYMLKEQMQAKLHDWFLKGRDPETGTFPDLPKASKGGSKRILEPEPPQLAPEEATALAAIKEKEAKGKEAKDQGEDPDAPKMSKAFLEDLHSAIEEYIQVWQDYQGPPDAAAPCTVPELVDLPQPTGGSSCDAVDLEMVRGEMRGLVTEEVRLEVDEDMRRLFASIKDMIKTAKKKDGRKKGKKGDKKRGDEKKGADKKKGGAKKAAGEKGGKKAGKQEGGEGEPRKARKKGKDLTSGRSIESIFAELASNGLVRECPQDMKVSHYLGGPNLTLEPTAEKGKKSLAEAGAKKPAAAKPAMSAKARAKGGAAAAGGAGAGAEELKPYPAPSMAQVRRAVAEACILPLGFPDLGSKVQLPRTVLLYGSPGSGKSLLCDAVASQAGATLFDLSPAATDGKYPAKQAALMVHMVFKAAKALAPSVVLIDEVEKVFISDKARAKQFGGTEPFNRIKRQLVAEVEDLEPGDGVLVLGASSHPDWCVKKDERALRTFFQRFIELPLPDYGSRQALLEAFGCRVGLQLASCCNLSLLAHMTEGYSCGQLQQIVRAVAARLGLPALPAPAGQEQHSPGGTSGGGPDSRSVGEEIQEQAAQQGRTPGSIRGPQQLRRPVTGSQRLARKGTPSVEDVLLEVLPGVAPLAEEEAKVLRDWTAKAHTPLPPEEPSKDDKKDGKK